MLNCVDLFAGAGGFSLAARHAGLKLKLAVELNAHAAATYRRNFCLSEDGPKLVVDDIRVLSPSDLAAEVFPAGSGCDLLLGGPPCQGFSTHRLNDAGVADARNDLIHVYFDFVRWFAPRAFLMENVPGMLWERHALSVQRFYRRGEELGYHLFEPVVLDARDFGVPQRRKRVFILGLRDDVDRRAIEWPPAPTHGSEVRRQTSTGVVAWLNCADAFGPASPEDPNDVHMMHSREIVAAFENTPANGGSRRSSGRVLKCHSSHDGHNDVYGRIDPAKPAPTMTTACINPSKGRFVHPTLHHGITVRQAARIQTFPDTFVFEGGLMAAGQQVGNAVPVVLAERLIRHLAAALRQAALWDEPAAGVAEMEPA